MRPTIALTAAAVMGLTLGGCGDAEPRSINDSEAQMIAALRVRNRADGVSGVRTAVPFQGGKMAVRGWIDWKRPLAYLAVFGPRPTLVQAMPGVIAVREGPFAGDRPPAEPPQDGWVLRELATGKPSTTVDAVVMALLLLTSDRPDNPLLIRQQGARWLRSDETGDRDVQVFLGPRGKTGGGAGDIRYWLDSGGRLQTMEFTPGTRQVVRIDFDRSDHSALTPVSPLLRLIPQERAAPKAAAARAARFSLRLPAAGGEIQGNGWTDWRRGLVYALFQGPGIGGSAHALISRGGISIAPGGQGPPPPRKEWRHVGWQRDAQITPGLGELNAFLRVLRVLTRSDVVVDAAATGRQTIAGASATGHVFAAPPELGTPGQGLGLRQWRAANGTVVRMEMRTATGGWAVADLSPGTFPDLPELPGM